MRTCIQIPIQTRRRIADAPSDAEPLWRGPGSGYFLMDEGDSTALYSCAAPPRLASGHAREIEIVRGPRRGARR
jgi:hypothetical protein